MPKRLIVGRSVDFFFAQLFQQLIFLKWEEAFFATQSISDSNVQFVCHMSSVELK